MQRLRPILHWALRWAHDPEGPTASVRFCKEKAPEREQSVACWGVLWANESTSAPRITCCVSVPKLFGSGNVSPGQTLCANRGGRFKEAQPEQIIQRFNKYPSAFGFTKFFNIHQILFSAHWPLFHSTQFVKHHFSLLLDCVVYE